MRRKGVLWVVLENDDQPLRSRGLILFYRSHSHAEKKWPNRRVVAWRGDDPSEDEIETPHIAVTPADVRAGAAAIRAANDKKKVAEKTVKRSEKQPNARLIVRHRGPFRCDKGGED